MNVYLNDIDIFDHELAYVDNNTNIAFQFHCWDKPDEFAAQQFATILSLTSPADYASKEAYAKEIEAHMQRNGRQGVFDCYTCE